MGKVDSIQDILLLLVVGVIAAIMFEIVNKLVLERI